VKNLKQLNYGGASCVLDPSMMQKVYNCIADAASDDCLNNVNIQEQFVNTYFNWIQDTKLNKIHNLAKFFKLSYSNGTSESFDKFYLKNSNKRFRCFRGEYMYHIAAWKKNFTNWCYLDEDAIRSDDAVIMSMPFSDTGDVHPDANKILEQCNMQSVPVLVDCAFVGICSDIEFDFDHDCITDVTFSLSKTFAVANMRIGMRCTKIDDDDSLFVMNKANYTNRLGAAVGLKLIQIHSVDYNFLRWRDQQLTFCRELDITPSKCVVFGLGNTRYQQYNRGMPTNRLCLANYMYQGYLPND